MGILAIDPVNTYGLSSIYNTDKDFNIQKESLLTDKEKDTSFESIFKSAYNLLNQTQNLTNKAEEEEVKYAVGEDNTLDLMVAQNKANVSLSYTVALRDKVLDAYREIMNMQF